MKTEAEILHYIFVVLSRSNYIIRRVDMPDGYCVFLEVGKVVFLFTREDIKSLVSIESMMDGCLYANLPMSMQRVLDYGEEYIEEGGKKDGKN